MLADISNAKNRVWISTAYFIPSGSLIRRLKKIALNGVDVRVLVPKNSDHPFMTWVSSSFYWSLLKQRIKLFAYEKSILHSKTIQIDNVSIVGSSNINHRSLYHDLELDVILNDPNSESELSRQFLLDISHSTEITFASYKAMSLTKRIAGRILLYFRYFL
jgi:cardiolipin synthase